MSILYKNHHKIFFCHVPRTGGRFITQRFLDNGYRVDTSIGANTIIEGTSEMHFHAKLYCKYHRLNNIQKFAVVRDPIERFRSGILYLFDFLWIKKIKKESLKEESKFFDIINQITESTSNNWFRPQHEFVSDELNIWKYEDGLGENFFSWLNEILIEPIEYSGETFYPSHECDSVTKIELSNEIIENIRKFYKKDFELFGYP